MTDETKNVEAVVNDVLVKWLPAGAKISAQAHLIDDLGLESASIMDVVMDLEDRLNIEVPVDQIVEIETVADLCGAIETLVKASK